MASLLVFCTHGLRVPGYDLFDVIEVLPAAASPGSTIEANEPWRYGFVYITDKDPSDPEMVAAKDGAYDDVADEVGDFEQVSKRKFRIIQNAIPGNPKRFLTYHPWGSDGSSVPNNCKYTWAQVKNYVKNKLDDSNPA